MAEQEKKEAGVNKAVVVLVDALLKDPKWSKIASVVIGCGVLVILCPAVTVCLLITLTVARTSAWAIWLGVGVALGVGTLMLVQWARRRRSARGAAGGET